MDAYDGNAGPSHNDSHGADANQVQLELDPEEQHMFTLLQADIASSLPFDNSSFEQPQQLEAFPDGRGHPGQFQDPLLPLADPFEVGDTAADMVLSPGGTTTNTLFHDDRGDQVDPQIHPFPASFDNSVIHDNHGDQAESQIQPFTPSFDNSVGHDSHQIHHQLDLQPNAGPPAHNVITDPALTGDPFHPVDYHPNTAVPAQHFQHEAGGLAIAHLSAHIITSAESLHLTRLPTAAEGFHTQHRYEFTHSPGLMLELRAGAVEPFQPMQFQWAVLCSGDVHMAASHGGSGTTHLLTSAAPIVVMPIAGTRAAAAAAQTTVVVAADDRPGAEPAAPPPGVNAGDNGSAAIQTRGFGGHGTARPEWQENALWTPIWDKKNRSGGGGGGRGEGRAPTHFKCKLCDAKPADWNGRRRHYDRRHTQQANEYWRVAAAIIACPRCAVRHTDAAHLYKDHMASAHNMEHPGDPRARSTRDKYLARKTKASRAQIVRDEAAALNAVKRRLRRLEEEARRRSTTYVSLHGLDLADVVVDVSEASEATTIVRLREEAERIGHRRFVNTAPGSWWQVADDLEAALQPEGRLAKALRTPQFGPERPFWDYDRSRPALRITAEGVWVLDESDEGMVRLPFGEQSRLANPREAPPGYRRGIAGIAVPIDRAVPKKRKQQIPGSDDKGDSDERR